jgi:hypothetical protein
MPAATENFAVGMPVEIGEIPRELKSFGARRIAE